MSSKFDRPIGETSIPKSYGKKTVSGPFANTSYPIRFVLCIIVWKCIVCQYCNMQIECKARQQISKDVFEPGECLYYQIDSAPFYQYQKMRMDSLISFRGSPDQSFFPCEITSPITYLMNIAHKDTSLSTAQTCTDVRNGNDVKLRQTKLGTSYQE